MTVHDQVERIYEAERDHVYAYLLYFGVPAPRAQELTQDAFLQLYRTMQSGTTIENPRAWLYRVGLNAARKSLGREPQFMALDPQYEPRGDRPDPEHGLLVRERQAALAAALRELSPQQRNCLHLRVKGLRYREIAEVVGVSSSAVGEFLRRAVVRLKEAIDG